MDTEVESEAKKKALIERISWRQYIPDIFTKVFLAILILMLFILIVYYSSLITPETNIINPSNVIGVFSANYIILIVLSSSLFILVLATFTKTLFIDHKEEFGLDNFRSKRVIFLFLLVVSFISAVYVLLDVALKNIYLTIGPVDVVWAISNILKVTLPTIDASTDRLAYAKIRTYYFFGFYLFMLIFPIFMFLALLTRYGRNKVFNKPEQAQQKNADTPLLKVLGVLFGPLLLFFLISVANSSGMTTVPRLILFIVILVFALWWVYQIIKLILKGIKLTAIFSYDNLIIFFPLLFLFYVLPVLLWSGWDLFKIFSMNGSTSQTALTEMGTPLANKVVTISSLSSGGFLNLISQIIAINSVYVIRILQLDFVFVVGLSAIAIGFSEGYSIIAIFTALTKGVSVARTGRIATQSPPKLIVMSTRLIMLLAYISFFWDRIVVILGILQTYFAIYFPFLVDIKLPRIFELILELHINIDLSFLGFFLPLSLLIIPLYYIIMSSFKFLSVSLIVDKTKNDQQIFFLLISAAFVLITTNILQDITASILVNTPSELAFLPTSYATAQFFISYANKLFEFLESVSFFAGLIVAIYLTLKKLKKRLWNRAKTKEIEERDKLYTTMS